MLNESLFSRSMNASDKANACMPIKVVLNFHFSSSSERNIDCMNEIPISGISSVVTKFSHKFSIEDEKLFNINSILSVLFSWVDKTLGVEHFCRLDGG